MPDYTVIQLKNFTGGLHLARGLSNAYDKTLDVLHSDKLKSAIFVCALQLYTSEKIDKSFLESFRISSAFPFYKSPAIDEPFYFFPKPEAFRLPEGVDGMEKKLKKVRYIEKGLFQQLLKGNADFKLTTNNLKGSFLTDSALEFNQILEQENCEAIMRTDPYQHVTISRNYGEDAVPYYVDKMYFHKNAGLFFLLEADNETVKKQVLAAIKLLADSGIGTDRNTGNGQFEYAISEINLEVPEKADFQLNLSLYCPTEDEIKEDVHRSYYGLIKRGGYISSPENPDNQKLRKSSVYMFTEGSVFPFKDNRKGKIVNLKPKNLPPDRAINHPIWRDGQPIFVPFNYQQSNES